MRSPLRILSVAAAVGFLVFFAWIVGIADDANTTPWWSFTDRIPYGESGRLVQLEAGFQRLVRISAMASRTFTLS